MYNPFSLTNKTILVTGASSGIGKATAIECARMGAKLIITGRNEQRLDETYESLLGDGHKKIVADLSDEKEIVDFVAELPLMNGIVHCAGVLETVPFSFINREKLEHIMGINFVSPTIITQMLLKAKKIEKGSSIVFVSSISGVISSSLGNSMYSASKGAINGMVKGMAIDLAPKKIRVNCVNPGMVETAIYDQGAINKEQLEQDKKNYPLGRYGQPEEVAFAIIYLLSDASSWTTGSNLILDGGYTLK